MGVDIYGRIPKISSQKPVLIDFENATDDERGEYFAKLDKWEDDNPGFYFRSNWWGWRPIAMLCDIAIKKYKLRISTKNWGSNDGAGCKNQNQCDKLANALEDMLSTDLSQTLSADDERIQICMGAWVKSGTGTFYSEEDTDLNREFPYGTVLFSPIVTKSGQMVESAHSCSRNHIKRWITFLRNCGGFEIW